MKFFLQLKITKTVRINAIINLVFIDIFVLILALIYKKLCIKIGIPELKFHGLRHTFATRCIESNGDYKTVSVLLGHSNINTTLNLYVHPNKDQKKKLINKMLKSL